MPEYPSADAHPLLESLNLFATYIRNALTAEAMIARVSLIMFPDLKRRHMGANRPEKHPNKIAERLSTVG